MWLFEALFFRCCAHVWSVFRSFHDWELAKLMLLLLLQGHRRMIVMACIAALFLQDGLFNLCCLFGGEPLNCFLFFLDTAVLQCLVGCSVSS